MISRADSSTLPLIQPFRFAIESSWFQIKTLHCFKSAIEAHPKVTFKKCANRVGLGFWAYTFLPTLFAGVLRFKTVFF